MARSKRTQIEQAVRDALRSAGVKPADGILAAVSGGVDSMVLASVLYSLRKKRVFGRLVVAHLDHGLRGRESDADCELVMSFATKHGIECFVEMADVALIAKREGLGIEETGRNERYKFFRRVAEAERLRWIATAHHSGDVLETILLNLARGTGLRGLVGVPATRVLSKNITIVRPLLSTTKAEIESYAKLHGIEWREDASNRSDAHARNRIRNEVIPALERAVPRRDLAVAAERLSNSVSEILSLLAHEAANLRRRSRILSKHPFFIADVEPAFKLDVLRGANLAVVRELLLSEFETALGAPYSPDAATWKRILTMVESGKPRTRQLSRALQIALEDNMLRIKTSKPKGDAHATLAIGKSLKTAVGTISLARTKRRAGRVGPNECLLGASLVQRHGLLMRSWEQGDKIRPFGLKGTRLVSDILAESGVRTREQKGRFPLVVLADEPKTVVWVPGIRASELCRIDGRSETALLLGRKP